MKPTSAIAGQPTRIGKDLMKTSKTDLTLALAIGLATLALTACDKPEPTAEAAQAATKPAGAASSGRMSRPQCPPPRLPEQKLGVRAVPASDWGGNDAVACPCLELN